MCWIRTVRAVKRHVLVCVQNRNKLLCHVCTCSHLSVTLKGGAFHFVNANEGSFFVTLNAIPAPPRGEWSALQIEKAGEDDASAVFT